MRTIRKQAINSKKVVAIWLTARSDERRGGYHMMFRALKFIMAMLLIAAVCPAFAMFGQSNDSLIQVMGMPGDARESAYLQMTFQTGNWKSGKAIAKHPYSVVISEDSSNGNTIFQLQVWRGVAARVDDDLLTDWDLLGVDANGNVVEVIVNYQRAIRGYFKAPSQNDFKSVVYAASYPWANLPTDAEAKSAGIKKIPNVGLIDIYKVLPKDGSAVISSRSGEVKQDLGIPTFLSDQPIQQVPFLEQVIDPIPIDIVGHWAQGYILDLMKKSIIVGYEDHTIRPSGVLTKAGFTTMLIHALRLNQIDLFITGFSDVQGHWAERAVNIALESGLVPGDSKLFHPNAEITRLEMARMMGLALKAMPAVRISETPTFKPLIDLQSVGQEDADVISKLASANVFSGDPSGKFRPHDSLTRAEACKVISAFLQLENEQ